MKKITKIYAMLLMGSITLCAVGICVYGAIAICNGRAPFWACNDVGWRLSL